MALTHLRLLIPEIVKQERIYQLCDKAKEAAANARKNFGTLKGVCGYDIPKLPTDKEIQQRATARFEAWLKKLDAIIIPLRHDKLDLKELIHLAVWKRPPFSPKGEKGFRDYLVLQAIREAYATNGCDKVAFLCHDDLLSTTSESAFDKKTFTVYKDLEAFESQLKLTREANNAEYVDALLEAAPSVFFTEGNPDCVYTSCHVLQQLRNAHSDSLDKYPWLAHSVYISQTQAGAQYTGGDILNMPYKVNSEERLICGDTALASVDHDRTMHWKTEIRLVRLFEHITPDTFDINSTMVRIAPFEIRWSCKEDGELNFSELKYEGAIAFPEEVEPLFSSQYQSGLTISTNWRDAT